MTKIYFIMFFESSLLNTNNFPRYWTLVLLSSALVGDLINVDVCQILQGKGGHIIAPSLEMFKAKLDKAMSNLV